jgi:hypothetical protein
MCNRADTKTACKEDIRTPVDSSALNLESIVRFLGFEAYSLESAVVRASCSDNKGNAILLLQLGAASRTRVLKEYNTKLLFRDFLLALNIRILKTAEAVRESSRRKLYGFEFLDVVREPNKGLYIKELYRISRKTALLDLVNAVGTVIICSNVGKAISAIERDTRKYKKCNNILQSRDYFAATFLYLLRLAEQRGVDLSISSNCIKLAEKAV